MTSPHKISISSEQKRIEELEAALRPFAEFISDRFPDELFSDNEVVIDAVPAAHSLRLAAFRTARAALSNTQPKGE